MEPQCPHCSLKFDSWPRARMHTKYCPRGKHPRRSIAQEVARRSRRAPLLAELTRNLFERR
jgi:hypothetical protein